MKKRMILGVPAIMILSGLNLFAQQGPPPAGMVGPRHDQMTSDLKLTDEQQKQIEKIHIEAKKEQIEQHAAVAKARVDLQELLQADTPSQSAIEKKLNEINSLQNQVQSKGLNIWFTINKLLTPEQQKVWKKRLAGHMAMGMGMGNGNRMGKMGRMRRGMERQMNRPMNRERMMR